MLLLILIAILKSCASIEEVAKVSSAKPEPLNLNELEEHTLVTDSEIFPYVVAIMKMSSYLSAGALITDNWVLTAADSLFLLRESIRTIRVRLGSINYRKGGIILPIRYYDIHPSFDDNSPLFDIAMISLSEDVRFTPRLKPIRLQENTKEADATHFIVTSWPYPMVSSEESEQHQNLKSMELIKRRRILSVTHIHPSEYEDCLEELTAIGIKDTETMMCLDTGVMMDPCMRDVGAPVVLNNVLWGIVSSWKPNNCENDLAGPSFVNLVSAPNITSWIRDTVEKHK